MRRRALSALVSPVGIRAEGGAASRPGGRLAGAPAGLRASQRGRGTSSSPVSGAVRGLPDVSGLAPVVRRGAAPGLPCRASSRRPHHSPGALRVRRSVAGPREPGLRASGAGGGGRRRAGPGSSKAPRRRAGSPRAGPSRAVPSGSGRDRTGEMRPRAGGDVGHDSPGSPAIPRTPPPRPTGGGSSPDTHPRGCRHRGGLASVERDVAAATAAARRRRLVLPPRTGGVGGAYPDGCAALGRPPASVAAGGWSAPAR